MYGYRIENASNVVIKEVSPVYLDKEVCMNNGSQNMDTDDNNLVLNEEEVEGPSQYEFAKLVLCILIHEKRNQKDYDYLQARRSIGVTAAE